MSAELADAERPDDDRLAEAEEWARGLARINVRRLAVLLAEYDRRGAEIERLRVQREAALQVCGTWDGVVGDGGLVAEEVRKGITVRTVTPEQVEAFARHLLDLVAEHRT